MNIIDKVIYKFNNFKNSYRYMKQLKQHMKNDPNWSNYRKQQAEEKNNQTKSPNRILQTMIQVNLVRKSRPNLKHRQEFHKQVVHEVYHLG